MVYTIKWFEKLKSYCQEKGHVISWFVHIFKMIRTLFSEVIIVSLDSILIYLLTMSKYNVARAA